MDRALTEPTVEIHRCGDRLSRCLFTADDLNQWVKTIEDGGLYKVKSDPLLPAKDADFMTITVQAKDKKTRVVIPLGEKLSQAIEKKIVELVKPGK